jgi:uncharacterized membrane protein YphA (DoxX/SURF4 family)
MCRSTAIILVLLRLAIGWHFLFEGLDKVHSLVVGPAETNRPFSSAGYFREAQGPLGGWMRGAIGDPYEDLRARVTLLELPAGEVEKPYKFIPIALERDWDDYSQRFTVFYELDDKQKERLASRLQQSKSNVVDFLRMTWEDKKPWKDMDDKEKAQKGIRKVKKTYPTGVVEVEESVPQRVAEYNALLAEVRKTQNEKPWAFGKDVEKQRLVKAKSDLEQQRAALAQDLAEKTAEMKKSLVELLTLEQRRVGYEKTLARKKIVLDPPPPGPEQQVSVVVSMMGLAAEPENVGLAGWTADKRLLTYSDPGEAPEAGPSRFLTFLDYATAYGLAGMGACLLLGLLTRTNCVLLAGFLLLTYLAMPAFPWLPVPPNNEGNYFYVNKNVIEMLALLALATTRSGRWLGLDGFFYWLFGGKDRKPNDPKEPTPDRPTNNQTANQIALANR